MKKTRGKKKEISSFKKVKKFFLFNKTITLVLTFVFLALAILLPIITVKNNANLSISGNSFLDNPPSMSAKWWNSVSWLNIGDTWREVIVFFITLAIIFVIIFDILSLTSIFSGWVSAVIAAGMAIVASLIGIVRIITTWLITVGATLGVAAGFLEIIVSIVIFIGLVFASPAITKFAAKRQATKFMVKAIKGAGEAAAGIYGSKTIGKEFTKKNK